MDDDPIRTAVIVLMMIFITVCGLYWAARIVLGLFGVWR